MLLRKVWIISGARRGVGKTYLAKHLCAVLPSSVYAKYGHGKPQRGKSEHFFTSEKALKTFIDQCRISHDHVVVEANAFGTVRRGDIRIFLEAGAAASDFRPDAEELRAEADICVGGRESRVEWEKVLMRSLKSSTLVDAVVDVLAEQQRWLRRSVLGVRSKLWFVNEVGQHVFGTGLSQLLVEVEHLGTLKEAAIRLKIPYRRAQRAIHMAEEQFGYPLIQTDPEDAGGNKIKLTKVSKRMLAVFLRLNEKAAAYIDKEFSRALGKELLKLKEMGELNEIRKPELSKKRKAAKEVKSPKQSKRTKKRK